MFVTREYKMHLAHSVQVTFSSIHCISLQIEAPLKPIQDDTSVNVVRLCCKQAWGSFREVASVTSGTKPWGTPRIKRVCPTDFWIVSYKVSVYHSYKVRYILLASGNLFYINLHALYHHDCYM